MGPPAAMSCSPKISRVRTGQSLAWSTRLLLERVKGIEPSSLGWEPIALPLSYTRAGATMLRAFLRERQLTCGEPLLAPPAHHPGGGIRTAKLTAAARLSARNGA